MKKSLLIALFGLIFIAFTSFKEVPPTTPAADGETSICQQKKESKEFADIKAFIKKYENLFKNAKSCEEMEEILTRMEKEIDNIPVYEEKDRMTKEEEGIVEEISNDFFNIVQQKAIEFGCE